MYGVIHQERKYGREEEEHESELHFESGGLAMTERRRVDMSRLGGPGFGSELGEKPGLEGRYGSHHLTAGDRRHGNR